MPDALNESALEFGRKKQQCLDFLEKLQPAVTELVQKFPCAAANRRMDPALVQGAHGKIAAETLKILVAGQFKTGKSTLINALLGEAVLPAFFTPCTAVITEVAYGETRAATLHFRQHIDRSALPGWLPEKVRAHIEASGESVPPLRIELNSPEELDDYLAIAEDEGEQGLAQNPVEVCRLRWPLDLCRGGIVIIDSPGPNENEMRDRTTLEYVPVADMILHVLNAQQLYGLPDQQFIQSLEIMGAVPLMFIVNRFDLVSPEKERERVRNYALKKLLPHSACGKDGIFFTAAAKGLQGRSGGDAVLLAESGIPDFERRIARVFANERIRIKLGHIRGPLDDVNYIVDEFLPGLEAALDEDAAKLERQYRSQIDIVKRLDSRINRIKSICATEISLFQERLQNELQKLFLEFRAARLPGIVENTDISMYNIGDDGEKTQAVALMVANIERELKDLLAAWQTETGAALYRETIGNIQREVEGELKDFNTLMNILDESWTIGDSPVGHHAVSIRVDGNGMLVAGGLAAGGGLAGMAALALLPARFLGALGGPVGWMVVVLTTGLGAVLAYWSKTTARRNLKESFIRETRRLMGEEYEKMARDASMEAANSIGESTLLLINELKKRLDDARAPILAAIAALRQSSGNVRAQKDFLAACRRRFACLQKEGRELAAQLWPEQTDNTC